MHTALTVLEKKRLAELVEAGTPIGEICEVIGRDRWMTRRDINYLARRPRPMVRCCSVRLVRAPGGVCEGANGVTGIDASRTPYARDDRCSRSCALAILSPSPWSAVIRGSRFTPRAFRPLARLTGRHTVIGDTEVRDG